MLHTEKPLPRNPVAVAGLVVSLAAFALACYGAAARPANLPAAPHDRLLPPDAERAVGYYAPLGLGVVGVALGVVGLRRIEAAGGKLGGDWSGVFAILLGGLSAVVGLVQVWGTHVWPALRPHLDG